MSLDDVESLTDSDYNPNEFGENDEESLEGMSPKEKIAELNRRGKVMSKLKPTDVISSKQGSNPKISARANKTNASLSTTSVSKNNRNSSSTLSSGSYFPWTETTSRFKTSAFLSPPITSSDPNVLSQDYKLGDEITDENGVTLPRPISSTKFLSNPSAPADYKFGDVITDENGVPLPHPPSSFSTFNSSISDKNLNGKSSPSSSISSSSFPVASTNRERMSSNFSPTPSIPIPRPSYPRKTPLLYSLSGMGRGNGSVDIGISAPEPTREKNVSTSAGFGSTLDSLRGKGSREREDESGSVGSDQRKGSSFESGRGRSNREGEDASGSFGIASYSSNSTYLPSSSSSSSALPTTSFRTNNFKGHEKQQDDDEEEEDAAQEEAEKLKIFFPGHVFVREVKLDDNISPGTDLMAKIFSRLDLNDKIDSEWLNQSLWSFFALLAFDSVATTTSRANSWDCYLLLVARIEAAIQNFENMSFFKTRLLRYLPNQEIPETFFNFLKDIKDMKPGKIFLNKHRVHCRDEYTLQLGLFGSKIWNRSDEVRREINNNINPLFLYLTRTKSGTGHNFNAVIEGIRSLTWTMEATTRAQTNARTMLSRVSNRLKKAKNIIQDPLEMYLNPKQGEEDNKDEGEDESPVVDEFKIPNFKEAYIEAYRKVFTKIDPSTYVPTYWIAFLLLGKPVGKDGRPVIEAGTLFMQENKHLCDAITMEHLESLSNSVTSKMKDEFQRLGAVHHHNSNLHGGPPRNKQRQKRAKRKGDVVNESEEEEEGPFTLHPKESGIKKHQIIITHERGNENLNNSRTSTLSTAPLDTQTPKLKQIKTLTDRIEVLESIIQTFSSGDENIAIYQSQKRDLLLQKLELLSQND